MDMKSLKRIAVLYSSLPLYSVIAWTNLILINKGVRYPKAVQRFLDDVVGVGCTVATGLAGPLIKQPRFRGVRAKISRATGAVLFLLGAVISIAAIRQREIIGLDDPARLVTQGTYGLMRHPTYASSFLMGWGWSLLMAAPYALIASPIQLLWMSVESFLEERLQLEPAFGEAYRRYRDSTPALFPQPLALLLPVVYIMTLLSMNRAS